MIDVWRIFGSASSLRRLTAEARAVGSGRQIFYSELLSTARIYAAPRAPCRRRNKRTSKRQRSPDADGLPCPYRQHATQLRSCAAGALWRRADRRQGNALTHGCYGGAAQHSQRQAPLTTHPSSTGTRLRAHACIVQSISRLSASWSTLGRRGCGVAGPGPTVHPSIYVYLSIYLHALMTAALTGRHTGANGGASQIGAVQGRQGRQPTAGCRAARYRV